jgi:peptide/nickel transport system permease protein
MSFFQILTRRLLVTPFLLLGMTVSVFLISHFLPGDPTTALLGQRAMENKEIVAAFKEKWGLDKPLYVQYVTYLNNLVHGDLGISIKTHNPITQDLGMFFPATVELALAAVLFSLAVGVPLGILSAVKRNQATDQVARAFSLIGVSTPIFWLGLITLYIFYFWLRWLPGPGRLDTGMTEPARVTGLFLVDSVLQGNPQSFVSALRHLILPAVVLGSATTGLITRITRSMMLDVLNQDYVRTARGKGLRERDVIFRHAFRNALIPTVTVLGLSIGSAMSGAVLTETIFAWPGIGRYAYGAALALDFPAIIGVSLLTGIIFVVANLVVDLTYIILDPRLHQ